MSLILGKTVSILLVATFTAGCSTFKSHTQVFNVTADPPDAEIYINGAMAGTGSASRSVKRDENVQVMVRRDGCDTVQRSIGKHMNETAILDAVGGVLILLPLIGLATPGAYDLDETNISVMLPHCKKRPSGRGSTR